MIVSESAALWRGSGLDIYQRSHADGESGQFNIVEPLTNRYVVRVWPHSHFLVKSRLTSTDTHLRLAGVGGGCTSERGRETGIPL